MREALQKLIKEYQIQVDLYEQQTQLPGFGNGGCCTETSITVAKQFISNLQEILNSNN